MFLSSVQKSILLITGVCSAARDNEDRCLTNADELPVSQTKFDRVRSALRTDRCCDSRSSPVRHMFCGSHISNYVTASLNLNTHTHGPAAWFFFFPRLPHGNLLGFTMWSIESDHVSCGHDDPPTKTCRATELQFYMAASSQQRLERIIVKKRNVNFNRTPRRLPLSVLT